LAWAYVNGLEAVCLRYFNVYGPNQRFDAYGNVIPIFVFNALAGRTINIYGDGLQTRDFVNVRDVVQANIRAATAQGVSGAFNIASATQLRILDLVAMIREQLTVPVRVEHVGKRAGDVEHSLADINKARKLLGFEPAVDIASGIVEYVKWATAEAKAVQNRNAAGTGAKNV
jgi:UDP-glucose 4-epimerase